MAAPVFKITEAKLAASATSVTFTIPGNTYSELTVILAIDQSVSTNIALKLNSTSSSGGYILDHATTTLTTGAIVSGSNNLLKTAVAPTTQGLIHIPNVSSTKYKRVMYRLHSYGAVHTLGAISYNITTNVTSIEISLTTGSMNIGSVITLCGVRV